MEESLPDFVVAENGYERHFTKNARAELHAIATTIHENDVAVAAVVELENFRKILRKSIADLHADGLLITDDLDGARNALYERIRTRIAELRIEFTHYFPAWTLGMEQKGPIVLGPVTIMTREQWLDTVEFSDVVKERYSRTDDGDANWKARVSEALKNGERSAEVDGLARHVYDAISHHPSILKITITGFEYDLSRKVGEIVCKAALDTISLLFGGQEYFHQQALADERLGPISSEKIVEIDGRLSIPGRLFGPRRRTISQDRARSYFEEHPDVTGAIKDILTALVDPANAKYPNLAKRWVTALDWMAEGQRERNDAVALAKIASSLDVLACGGKFSGILEMVSHLTGARPDDVVVKGLKPRTLRAVIKEIYDDGRSQILHGTHFDRLKSFETTKFFAAHFARLALFECALRLREFSGDDNDSIAFRAMPDCASRAA